MSEVSPADCRIMSSPIASSWTLNLNGLSLNVRLGCEEKTFKAPAKTSDSLWLQHRNTQSLSASLTHSCPFEISLGIALAVFYADSIDFN